MYTATFCISECSPSILNMLWFVIFFFFPQSNELHFYFVLFLTFVTQHGKSSLLGREDICNFSLVMDERDQRKQKKPQIAERCYTAKTIQVTEEIWEGFTPCELDFGGCRGFTTAPSRIKPHVEQRKKGLDIYMHFLLSDWWINDSLPGADVSVFESPFTSLYNEKLNGASTSYLDPFAPTLSPPTFSFNAS